MRKKKKLKKQLKIIVPMNHNCIFETVTGQEDNNNNCKLETVIVLELTSSSDTEV